MRDRADQGNTIQVTTRRGRPWASFDTSQPTFAVGKPKLKGACDRAGNKLTKTGIFPAKSRGHGKPGRSDRTPGQYSAYLKRPA